MCFASIPASARSGVQRCKAAAALKAERRSALSPVYSLVLRVSSTRHRSTCCSNTCLNSFCVITHTSFDIEKPATLRSVRIAGGFIILGCYSALISFSNSLTALMTVSKVGTSP